LNRYSQVRKTYFPEGRSKSSNCKAAGSEKPGAYCVVREDFERPRTQQVDFFTGLLKDMKDERNRRQETDDTDDQQADHQFTRLVSP
jgi:hypothetical protein